MGETPPKTESTAAAPVEGETEADLEITPLHPASSTHRFLRERHVGAAPARRRRVGVSVLLVGLALVLAVVTPLPRALWSLMAPSPTATGNATRTSVRVSITMVPVTITASASATKAPGLIAQPNDWRTPQAWSTLQARPLHFPTVPSGAPCPVSPVQRFNTDLGLGMGDGPVYPYSFTPDGQPDIPAVPPRQTANGVVPGFSPLLWAIAPSYRGGVLVRGAQLDGPHPVSFNGGYAQISYEGNEADAPLLKELQLVGFAGDKVEWVVYGSSVRLEAPGCYAFQVDGSTFSYLLVFRSAI